MSNLIGSREAAHILRTSRSTVQRLASSGELTAAQKLPGTLGAYLFDPAEVQRVAAERAHA